MNMAFLRLSLTIFAVFQPIMQKSFFIFCALVTSSFLATGQKFKDGYWQQRADYSIDVNLNHETHRYNGKEVIVYTNNSPETITQVHLHLYFNAFRPGSSMDIRSRTIEDPDPRVGSRIAALKPDEQGFLHVTTMKQNGKEVPFMERETILTVTLLKPLKPGAKTKFELTFEGQVPLQVRRSGRDNKEGIDYSMSQWYPKMCEFDTWGWHTDTYIGREFYGVWGNFNVNITMNSSYVLGATGVLQNPSEVGCGYEAAGTKVKPAGTLKTWKWKAENVHDFVWAADPDYRHDKLTTEDGVVMHFLYQDTPEYGQTWRDAQNLISKGFTYLSENFGQYPYPVYSVIQGGDGGMEYPMATLITGNRKTPSLVGVVMHEGAHAWYHGVLGFNESKYFWMDEGFTSYSSTEAMDHLFPLNADKHKDAYSGYLRIIKDRMEEPLSVHADHFNTNYAYGTAAYSKGEVYLAQLDYLLGDDNQNKALMQFFNTWKFRHPDDRALIRAMEQVSGLELDWYNQYMTGSIRTIDYAIDTVYGDAASTLVRLERVGEMPMPVEVLVELKDGSTERYYIPLDLMMGSRPLKSEKSLQTWQWVAPYYDFVVPHAMDKVKNIVVDPDMGTADTDRTNNSLITE